MTAAVIALPRTRSAVAPAYLASLRRQQRLQVLCLRAGQLIRAGAAAKRLGDAARAERLLRLAGAAVELAGLPSEILAERVPA